MQPRHGSQGSRRPAGSIPAASGQDPRLDPLAKELYRYRPGKLTEVLDDSIRGISENRSKIIKALEEQGREIPDHLQRAPLKPELIFYWRAFIELRTCAVDGVIPWTAIDRYTERFRVRYPDIFLEVIRGLEKLPETEQARFRLMEQKRPRFESGAFRTL